MPPHVTVKDFVSAIDPVPTKGRRRTSKVVVTPVDGYTAATNVAWIILTSLLTLYTVRTFVHPYINRLTPTSS